MIGNKPTKSHGFPNRERYEPETQYDALLQITKRRDEIAGYFPNPQPVPDVLSFEKFHLHGFLLFLLLFLLQIRFVKLEEGSYKLLSRSRCGIYVIVVLCKETLFPLLGGLHRL